MKTYLYIYIWITYKCFCSQKRKRSQELFWCFLCLSFVCLSIFTLFELKEESICIGLLYLMSSIALVLLM